MVRPDRFLKPVRSKVIGISNDKKIFFSNISNIN